MDRIGSKLRWVFGAAMLVGHLVWLNGCDRCAAGGAPGLQVQNDLRALEVAVRDYLVRTGVPPTSIGALTTATDGIPALTSTTTDPWGAGYTVDRLGDWIEIRSAGPDGTANSDDDVWRRVPLVREPSPP